MLDSAPSHEWCMRHRVVPADWSQLAEVTACWAHQLREQAQASISQSLMSLCDSASVCWERNLDVGQLICLSCILLRSTSVFISFTSPTGFTQGTCNLSSEALFLCVYRRGQPPKGFTNAFLLENEDSGTNAVMFWCCLSSVCQTAPAEALCVCVCHCAHVKGELWDCCLHGCYCEACCSVMAMRQLLCTSAAVSASAVSREIFFLNQQCRHLFCFYVLSVSWMTSLSASHCTVCVLRWGLFCLRARQDYCRIGFVYLMLYWLTGRVDHTNVEQILYFQLCVIM